MSAAVQDTVLRIGPREPALGRYSLASIVFSHLIFGFATSPCRRLPLSAVQCSNHRMQRPNVDQASPGTRETRLAGRRRIRTGTWRTVGVTDAGTDAPLWTSRWSSSQWKQDIYCKLLVFYYLLQLGSLHRTLRETFMVPVGLKHSVF